jgi:hypothetical protein
MSQRNYLVWWAEKGYHGSQFFGPLLYQLSYLGEPAHQCRVARMQARSIDFSLLEEAQERRVRTQDNKDERRGSPPWAPRRLEF